MDIFAQFHYVVNTVQELIVHYMPGIVTLAACKLVWDMFYQAVFIRGRDVS